MMQNKNVVNIPFMFSPTLLLMTVTVHGYDKLTPSTADIFELTSLFDRGHWIVQVLLVAI